MDSATTAFLQRELEVIKSTLYEVQYPELKFRQLTPIDNEGFLGQQSVIVQSVSMMGKADFVTGATTKIPRSDIGISEYPRPVLPFATEFGFTIFEIEAAKRSGRSLSDLKARSARRALEEKLNGIFWGTDAQATNLGIYGLLTHPDTSNTAVSGAVWTSKTPDQILFDINDMFSDQNEATEGVEIGTRLLLPIAQYNYLHNTRLTDTGMNILTYIVQNSRFLKSVESIIPCRELNGAGTGATDLMVAYNPDPMAMMMHVPVDAFFTAPQEKGLEQVVYGIGASGGLNLLRPKSVYMRYGI
jgi:hypothetical protein